MIDALLSETELTSKIQVSNRGDCERLSELILERTDEFISYNTLRRLYGLAPGGSPHRKTLDILSMYCGFAHYQDFCRQAPELNSWHLKSQLHRLKDSGSAEDVVAFFRELPTSLAKLELLLATCREWMLEERWTDLVSILNPQIHRPADYNYTYQLHFALSLGGQIAQAIARMPLELLGHPGMVDAVFLRLIDCSALNGYYGYWADQLKACNVSNETSIFLACIDQLRAFLNAEPLPPFQPQWGTKDRHPVALVGRVFTVWRMRNPDAILEELWQNLLKCMPPEDDSFSIFIEPSTFAIVTGDLGLAAWLCRRIRMHTALLKEFQHHDLQVHILLQTMHALGSGQQQDAKKWFQQFNHDQIRDPSFSHLLHFAIRRIEAEINGTSSDIPQDVHETCARLGHNWFSSDRWHRFFA